MPLTDDEKTAVMIALRGRQLELGKCASQAKELNMSENYVFWLNEIAVCEAAYNKILRAE